MDSKSIILLIFGAVYLLLVFRKKYEAVTVWVGTVAMVMLGKGVLTPVEVFKAIDWNVIAIFAGTLILAELFTDSKVPAYLADALIVRAKTVGGAALLVCVASSFISIAVANVATVLIIAPIAIQLARRLNVSAVPFLVGISISSNLQGTATLIGDPPSMILAAHEGMGFLDFFWYQGKPSIFFAVQVGAVLSFVVLHLFYRRHKQPVVPPEFVEVTSWVPTILIGVMIVALAAATSHNLKWAGPICMILAAVGVVWAMMSDKKAVQHAVKRYDYSTTALLAGIFALVGGLQQAGVLSDIARFIAGVVGSNKLLAYTIIVWFSVFASAFIDNIPYVVAMLPVVRQVSIAMGLPNDYVLAFGLVIGACLGGNITHVGSATNVVSLGILRRQGYRAGFTDFARMGLPFTVAATFGGYVFIWLVWGV